jgi:hypothetical protein
MKLASIEGRFRIASDALPCPDPFGFGMVFLMHRLNGARHKRLQRDAATTDPVMAQALLRYFDTETERLAAEVAAKKSPKPAEPKPVVELLQPGDLAEAKPLSVEQLEAIAEDEYRLSALQAMRAALAAGDLEALERLSPGYQMRELVVGLCEGWQQSWVLNDDDTPMAFSADALRQLLRRDDEVAEGVPHAGEPLGDALTDHLFHFVSSHDAARARMLEGAEAKPEASSAGA